MQPPEKRGYQISLVIRRVGGLEERRGAAPSAVFVIRRVGGLEVDQHFGDLTAFVIRRVGGLEGIACGDFPPFIVIRRVGGLEGDDAGLWCARPVIRRVGGLDCQKLRPHSAAGAFVLEHVQGEVDADFRLSSPYGIPHSSHIGR